MGTNFYARRIPKVKESQEAHTLLNDFLTGKSDPEGTEFQDYLNSIAKQIHLGKRSAGWQFLWRSNPDFYEDNLKSIKKFLESPDWIIIDEYGGKFSVSEFFDDEIENFLYEGHTLETWNRDHPEELIRLPKSVTGEWITKDNLRFCDRDFS